MTGVYTYKVVTPKPDVELLLRIIPHSVVAGGAAREALFPAIPAEDIDLFVLEGGDFEEARRSLEDAGFRADISYREGLWTFQSRSYPGGIGVRLARPIQLIDATSASNVVDLWSDFGWRTEQFALVYTPTFETFMVSAAEFAEWDTLNRALVPVDPRGAKLRQEGVRSPVRMLARIAKYGKKGYTVDTQSILDILDAYRALDSNETERVRQTFEVKGY